MPGGAVQFPEDQMRDLFGWLQIKSVEDADSKTDLVKALKDRVGRLSEEKQTQLNKQLLMIHEVVKNLHEMKILGKFHRFSKGDLSAWWDMVGQNAHRDLIKLFPETPRTEEANKNADRVMTGVYVGLNLLTLALAGLACANVSDLGKLSFMLTGTANTVVASSWNYIDVIGGVVQGWHEMKLGNYGRGTAAIVSSSQLAACTMAGNIGVHVGTVSAAGFAGLTGFSFAACMYIAMLTDIASAYQIDQKIKKVEEKRDTVLAELKQKKEACNEKKRSLQKLQGELHALTMSMKSKIQRDIQAAYALLQKSSARISDLHINYSGRKKPANYVELMEKYERETVELEKAYTRCVKTREDRIKLLKETIIPREEQAVKTAESGIDTLKQKASLYKKTILYEKAKQADLYRSAKSWGACAIGMTAVAVVAFIVANGATFGAATGIAVGVAAVAVISSIVRAWWVQQKNYEGNLKRSLTEGKPIQDRIDKLNFKVLEKIYGFDFEKTVSHSFFKSKKSMKAYLEDMQFRDPDKANRLVTTLENGLDGVKECMEHSNMRLQVEGEEIEDQVAYALKNGLGDIKEVAEQSKGHFIRLLKEKRSSLPGSTEGEDLFQALDGSEDLSFKPK